MQLPFPGPSLCMVCGAERPDHLIGIHKRPSSIQLPAGWPGDAVGELQDNVRYCTDNPDCVAVAHEDGPWPGWGGGRGRPHPLHNPRQQEGGDEPGNRQRPQKAAGGNHTDAGTEGGPSQ